MTALSGLLDLFPTPSLPNGQPMVPIGINFLDANDFRIAAAWTLVEKSWAAPEEPQPDEENALWAWIWSGVNYDVAMLSIAANMDERSVERKLQSLAMQRLVYPDGRTTPWFRHLTAAAMRDRLGTKKDSAAKKPVAPPPPPEEVPQ